MFHRRHPSEDEDAGRFDARRCVLRGLQVVEEDGGFRIDPGPFRMRWWALTLATITSSFLLKEAVRGGPMTYPLIGAALFGSAVMAMEYALACHDSSRGPFVVVDHDRGTIAIPRSGDVYAIADVEAVTLRRDSWAGPDGLENAALIDLTIRRGESVEEVEAVWSRQVVEIDRVAHHLAWAIDRPLLLDPGVSG